MFRKIYVPVDNSDYSNRAIDLAVEIGRAFGGRDHTTVLHGVNTVGRLMKSDPTLFDRVTALLQSLRRTT